MASDPGPVSIRSVVRADTRGKLVRTVVVSPRVVPSRPVETARRVSEADVSIPELVEATAKKYDVDPLLVHSVIEVESNYNASAVSPKGAQGMMQLMPGTARRFGVGNAFDARQNIEGGVRYLKYLQTLFPNDPRLAIAAYNAGEAAVWKYNNQIPPYPETEQYVYRVGSKYGKARRNAKPKPVAVTASTPRAEAPAAPAYPPLESYIDAEGRLHMQTVTASNAPSLVSTP